MRNSNNQTSILEVSTVYAKLEKTKSCCRLESCIMNMYRSVLEIVGNKELCMALFVLLLEAKPKKV